MATIVPYIILSRPNQDGTHTIKFKITNGARVAYITTQYSVEKKQWNGVQVVKHPQAAMINAALFKLLNEYQKRLNELNPPKNISASQIKEWLESGNLLPMGNTIKFFGEKYIQQLIDNSQNSYAQNMSYTLRYLTDCFGFDLRLSAITASAIKMWEKWLIRMGSSQTTINIRMTHLKALLNAAVAEGAVEYKIFPFRGYKMPAKNVREIWITKEEFNRLREYEFNGSWERRYNVARDLFMLSFYFAGINLTDLLDARLDGDTINFVRKKTATKKTGEKGVSLTIQPEARAIITKYITEDGTLDFGYNFRDYGQFRSFITKGLNKIGELLCFEKKLMFYSARKTFVQFGQQLGIPLYVLEYAIGQSIKDANSRPIFDYMRVMRFQADLAIRAIIDYTLNESPDEEMPIPEWARKH